MTDLNNDSPQRPHYEYYGSPPPLPLPKRHHRFRNYVVLPLLGLVTVIVLVTALSSGGGKPAGDTADPAGSGIIPGNQTDPHPVTPGVAFTLGKHRFNAGWRLEYDEIMGSDLSGSVTNVSGSTSTAFFSVKFLRGTTVLANFQCASSELEPGQTEVITCPNEVTTTDRVTGWTSVTAETTF